MDNFKLNNKFLSKSIVVIETIPTDFYADFSVIESWIVKSAFT